MAMRVMRPSSVTLGGRAPAAPLVSLAWRSTPRTAATSTPRRCTSAAPTPPSRGTGWLEGWRLTFGGEDLGWEGSLATLVEAPGEHVFVGLYDMTDADAAQLDAWEGADTGLYRKLRVRVHTLDGDQLCLGLRPRRLRGRAALRALPRRARRRRRGRRRAGGLPARAAHPPLPLDRRPVTRLRLARRQAARQRAPAPSRRSDRAPPPAAPPRRRRTRPGAGRAAAPGRAA